MNKITQFKDFVKKHPSLIKYVKDESMTWQNFFEMYDIYGEENTIWENYIPQKEVVEEIENSDQGANFSDIVGWLKGINLDKMQEGISSVQRVLGVLGDFGTKDTTSAKPEYKPRPLYKHFED